MTATKKKQKKQALPERRWVQDIEVDPKVQTIFIQLIGKQGLFKTERKDFHFRPNGNKMRITLEVLK